MAQTIDLSNTTVGNPASRRRNINNADGYAVWADITSATISGRLFHVEKVRNNESEFLSVTMISAFADGDTTGTQVKFNTSDRGLMKLFDGGHLPNGRRMTAVGQLKSASSHYVNKDGLVVPLKRPQIELKGVSVQLGAKPGSRQAAA